MKPKSYPTKPFQMLYRVWDDKLKSFAFETDDRKELYTVFQKEYRFVRHFKNISFWDSPYDIGPRYSIFNQYGEEVSFDDLRAEFYEYKPRNRRVKSDAPDVRYQKGNPNKIKRGYYEWSRYWRADYNPKADWYEAPFKFGWFRPVRTRNETRQNAAHEQDIGPEIIRGRRRGRNLPSSWDDLPNSKQKSSKSWKHHSKRRKQWKAK